MRWFRKWLGRGIALIVGGGTLWAVYMADRGDLVTIRQVSRHVPGGDAGLHVMVMGALVLAFSFGFADARVAGRRLGVAGIALLVTLFATAEELHQLLQPWRRFSLRDLFFSYLGIALATALIWLVTRSVRAVGERDLDR